MSVSLSLPVVGGDYNAWGGELNAALTTLAEAVDAAQAAADGAQETADAVGTPSPVENVNAVATSGAAQTLPDVTTATVHRITLTANCTLTFPAAAAGKSFTVVLVQDGTGSRTVTWPGSVLWPGGTAPTLTTTAAKRDVFTFMCADGTNWLGFTAGQNF